MKYDFIGIDVGGHGGYAQLTEDGDIIALGAVPQSSGRADFFKFCSLLPTPDRLNSVWIEDVHSIYGMSAKSNFNFGQAKGVVIGKYYAYGVNPNLIRPKAWQKLIWTDEDIVLLDNKKKDTKLTSLRACRRIFGNDVDLLATKRSRVPHNGIVDALLIAEAGRRSWINKTTR